ncbi:uncharacterized protein LOC660428 [Tribolium castaneum]|uniref:uncharacterized protein LOC660428 n=1 Tax=Tribolium castaneum TaxID=7070 RepID=UPI0001758501|nr:PREDICTED: zingipain-2 [Tribolium castaneum]XP_015836750.1 PREDICTED: zingipain-2 [Tribolium castaneum]XP_015836751.1 PREDICTED: zingipain-2 [Tribolium castaneum]|eukprot:XP_015836749.1 PREDICTED: zingipain-2 [Tribolium castaneum]
MKVLTLLVVLHTSDAFSLNKEWENFKRKYERRYPNLEEENFRRAIFEKTFQEIKHHNERYRKGLETYYLRINDLSDYTDEEMSCCSEKAPKPSITILPNVSTSSRQNLPKMVDWRLRGVVTPVKHQGKCGTCWAFAIIGATEAQYRIHRGSFVILSEQQLVDCVREVSSCRGVYLHETYKYIVKSEGINYDQDYRYQSAPGTCRFRADKPKITFRKYAYLTAISEEDLQWIVANVGPVTVSFDGRGKQFKSYSGGVFYNKTCTRMKTHVAVLVGYGTENGEDFWLVKNSYGPQWGLDGYVKIARNRNNHCGITNRITYPIFD